MVLKLNLKEQRLKERSFIKRKKSFSAFMLTVSVQKRNISDSKMAYQKKLKALRKPMVLLGFRALKREKLCGDEDV